MTVVQAFVASALIVLGAIFAAFALYQVVLAVAAFFLRGARKRGARADPPRTRLVVLVPAHDEAALIGRCIRSLQGQTYPEHLRDVVVIADNCTDDTADIARSAGADVLVRDQPHERGKGRALRWALDRVLDRMPEPDAIVVVDADSVADPEFLGTLVRRFEGGAVVVQGESLLAEDGTTATALRAAAFLLVNRVRPAGRAALGLPCNLSGNGMLFGRDVLREHPWDAFTSAEDVEYSIRLRRAGVRPAFAGGAIVLSPAAPTRQAALDQQLRWEGGKFHVARTQIPRLVAAAIRERRPSLLDPAVELASPPLGFLAAGALGGTAVAAPLAWTGLVTSWSLVPWLVAVVSIPLYVVLGLRAGRAPASAYRSLARAPLFVLTKAARARRLFTFRPDTWVRTERQSSDAVRSNDSAPGG